MRIIQRYDILLSNGESVAPFYVLDNEENIIFEGTTEEECIEFIGV